MRTWQREVKAELAALGQGVAKIHEKRDRFTAREWLFALVHEWLDDAKGARLMLLTGEGGVGVSR